jgi:hypothetical protein
MTFDDDFVLIGRIRATLKDLGLEWPPPPYMKITRFGALPDMIVKRLRLSDIPDEARAQMTNVCRGAEYEVCLVTDLPEGYSLQ